MATTEVLASGGWKTPSTLAAPVPAAGAAPVVVSSVVDPAKITTSSAEVVLTADQPMMRVFYWSGDQAALGAFTPAAFGEAPPAGITKNQPSTGGYLVSRTFTVSGFPAGTKIYYRHQIRNEAGQVTLDVVRSFTTVSSTAAPVSGDGSGLKLKWRPPTGWENFTVRNVKAGTNLLNDGTDYLLVWPNTPIDGNGGVTIMGGRNIVSFGGRIHLTQIYGSGQTPNRALNIHGGQNPYAGRGNRTVHIEGLHCSGVLHEGINIDLNDALNVDVHLSNILVGSQSQPVHAYLGTHADVLQNWNGPRRLMLDNLTGYSDYQCHMIQPHQFAAYANTNPGGTAPAFNDRWYLESWDTWYRNVQFYMPLTSGTVIFNGAPGAPWNSTGTQRIPKKFSSENCWYWVPPDKTSKNFVNTTTSDPSPQFDMWQKGFNTSIAKTADKVGIGYVSPGYI